MRQRFERWADVTGTEWAAERQGGPVEYPRVPDDGISLNKLTKPLLGVRVLMRLGISASRYYSRRRRR